MLEKCKIIEFMELGDSLGKLVAIEEKSAVPFTLKRVFYIYDTSTGVVRGQHANKNSEFVLICLSGSCKVKLFDGHKEKIVVLDKPNKGLYIPKMIWKDMYDFSSDAVLLALSDCCYDSSEYIRNLEEYQEFMEQLK